MAMLEVRTTYKLLRVSHSTGQDSSMNSHHVPLSDVSVNDDGAETFL